MCKCLKKPERRNRKKAGNASREIREFPDCGFYKAKVENPGLRHTGAGRTGSQEQQSGRLLFSVFSQYIEEVLHIIGQGGFEGDDFFGCGVLEGYCPCVKGAAGDNGSFGG